MVSPYTFASSMMPSVVVRQKSAFGDEAFSTVSHASCGMEMFLMHEWTYEGSEPPKTKLRFMMMDYYRKQIAFGGMHAKGVSDEERARIALGE